jgi:hypothetical protein
MARSVLLGIMATEAERAVAHRVAERENRTLSDLVRLMLRERARELGIDVAQIENHRPAYGRKAA